MTQLELAVINNYIEWLETPENRKLKLKLINARAKYLVKLWQKEKKCSEEKAKIEIEKLVLNVVWGIKREEKKNESLSSI